MLLLQPAHPATMDEPEAAVVAAAWLDDLVSRSACPLQPLHVCISVGNNGALVYAYVLQLGAAALKLARRDIEGAAG
jgi:hypothetical protein